MSSKKLPLIPAANYPSALEGSHEALVSPVQSAHEPVLTDRFLRGERTGLTRGDSGRSVISQVSDNSNALPGASLALDRMQRQKHHDIELSLSEKLKRNEPRGDCKQFSSQHWWLFEVGAEALAFISLGMMLFVLWYYNDKPQAQWQYSHVTLNGVVSFLATVARTGLMVPVSAAIGQRKWLRYLPGRNRKQRSRRLQDFEAFDDASRGSLGSLKLMWAVRFW